MTTQTSLPSTMRAWVYKSRGTPSQILQLSTTRAAPPSPTGSNVVVRVTHCALNQVGTTIMGLVPSIFGSTWGAPELDLAGTVVAAGPNASPATSTLGTQVWGFKPIPTVMSDHAGTLAEYVTVDSNLVVPLAPGMSAEQASGLGIVGCTALQLLQQVGVGSGDRVLINGASGGVGSMAVQIAKAMDIHVAGTCSGGNIELVKSLGADEVIDYRTAEPSLPGFLKSECSSRPFDAIIDCVGKQDLYEGSPSYLKAGHTYITVGAMDGIWGMAIRFMRNTLLPIFLGGTPRKWVFYQLQFVPSTVKELSALASEGKVKALVDSSYSMENALQGYERLNSNRAKGKVVIKVAE